MYVKVRDGVRWLQYRWSVRYARCATHQIYAQREVLRLLRRCGESQLCVCCCGAGCDGRRKSRTCV